ncbi:MAG: hypothetical protein PHV42_03305 [Candidatus Pacebacteria bacterium]|nr:hypothetical protein [Candidatus Paceibacterota bacterium]
MKRTFFFIILILFGTSFFVSPAFASQTDGTIDGTNKYAKFYDTTYGTINFGVATGNVHVTDTELTGFAFGNYVGWISLNCSNSISPGCTGSGPGGNGDWHVANDAEGNLSGYGWGEQTGWVNFKPTFGGVAPVTIDSNGDFHGYAWSQNFGWIVFNSATHDLGVGSFKVSTDWRPASVRGATPTPTPCVGCGGGGGGSTPTPTAEGTPTPGPVEATPTPTPVGATPTPAGETPTPTPGPVESSPTPAPTSVPPAGTPGPTPDLGGPTPPPSLPPIINNLVDTLGNGTGQAVDDVRVVTKQAIKNPTGLILSQTLPTVGVVVQTTAALTAVFATPIVFSEIVFLPLRLWSLLLGIFGLKKKKRQPWGVVYDSITKQPLDPAYVVLMGANGEEITSSITDLDGRYGFLLEPGRYKLVANKTNYTFPSKKLAGQTSDVLYTDLYFGEEIVVGQAGETVTKNIPLDPLKFDFNEFAKSKQQLTKFYSRHDVLIHRISNAFFFIGFIVAALTLLVAPEPYNTIIFGVYIFMLALKYLVFRPTPTGSLIDKETKLPLSFAIVRVFSVSLGREMTHRVADIHGRYYCLVPFGDYYVTVEKKNDDGTYTKVFTSPTIHAGKNGLIKESYTITTSGMLADQALPPSNPIMPSGPMV